MFEPDEMRRCAQEPLNVFSRGYRTKRMARAASMAVNTVVGRVPALHSRLAFGEPAKLPSERLDVRLFMLDFRLGKLRHNPGPDGIDDFVPLKARR
jgi:hypothetical protein